MTASLPATSLVVRLATSKDDRAACIEIRRRVFIDEQHVPEALEIDHHEDESRFVLARQGSEPVGCCRFRRAGDVVKVERVATLAAHRGHGIGRAVMACMEREAAAEAGAMPLFMHAQDSALDFYQRLGFTWIGGGFLDADIDHHAMIKLTVADGRPVRLERITEAALPAAARALIEDVLDEYGLPITTSDLDDLTTHYQGGAFYVVYVAGRLVGTGAWKPALDAGEKTVAIRRMFLAPTARGLSLGRQLLIALERDAAYHEYRRVILETASPLREAIQLYEHRGYERIARTLDPCGCDVRLARNLPAPEI